MYLDHLRTRDMIEAEYEAALDRVQDYDTIWAVDVHNPGRLMLTNDPVLFLIWAVADNVVLVLPDTALYMIERDFARRNFILN